MKKYFITSALLNVNAETFAQNGFIATFISCIALLVAGIYCAANHITDSNSTAMIILATVPVLFGGWALSHVTAKFLSKWQVRKLRDAVKHNWLASTMYNNKHWHRLDTLHTNSRSIYVCGLKMGECWNLSEWYNAQKMVDALQYAERYNY